MGRRVPCNPFGEESRTRRSAPITTLVASGFSHCRLEKSPRCSMRNPARAVMYPDTGCRISRLRSDPMNLTS